MASETALSPPAAEEAKRLRRSPPSADAAATSPIIEDEQRPTMPWLPRDLQLKIWNMKEEIERAEHEIGWSHVMHQVV
jgi:hypothetical protein